MSKSGGIPFLLFPPFPKTLSDFVQFWGSDNSTFDPPFAFQPPSDLIPNCLWILGKFYGTLICLWIACRLKIGPLPTIALLTECVLVNVTLLLVSPLIAAVYVIVQSLRFCIQTIFDLNGSRLRLMEGEDAFWSIETHANSCAFTSMYVLRGEANLPRLQERFLHKLVRKIDPSSGIEIYSKLTCKVKRKWGFLCWEDEDLYDPIDIRRHVFLMNVTGHSMTNRGITESQLFSRLSDLINQPLDISKPPWEVIVVPNFMYDSGIPGEKYYALIYRIHHGLMDGISAGLALQYGFGDAPVPLTVDPFTVPRVPLWAKGFALAKLGLFGARTFLGSLCFNEQNVFHPGQKLTGPKATGWTRRIRISALKTIKDRTKTSTTAIFIAAFGGAMQRLASSYKLTLPNLIFAAPTLAILPYPSCSPQNRFTVTHIGVNTKSGMKASLARVKEAHKQVVSLTRSYDVHLNYVLTCLIGKCPVAITTFFKSMIHATAIVSNVPGPKGIPRILGDEIVDVGAWVPIKGKSGIGFALFSFGGMLRVSIVADQVALPHLNRDIHGLIKGYEAEITALGNATKVPSYKIFR